MTTINLNEANVPLAEIVLLLKPGEQVSIVRDGQPVALLTRTSSQQWPCQAGSAKATKHWMAPDFNAPLEDFREYME